MNIEEDSIIEGFIVVEKTTYEYDENSFKSFLSSLETPKKAFYQIDLIRY